jgi:hypothetical protein
MVTLKKREALLNQGELIERINARGAKPDIATAPMSYLRNPPHTPSAAVHSAGPRASPSRPKVKRRLRKKTKP